MRTRMLAALLLTGVLLACGCAVMQSSQSPHKVYSNISSEDAGAFGYFLPKRVIKLKYTAVASELTIDFLTIPDPNYFYTLRYLPIPTSADDVKIVITKEGLLKSIDITVEDKWSEIIGKIMEIAKEAAKATIPIPGALTKAKGKGNIEITIDPDIFIYGDQEKRDALDKELQEYGLTIDIRRQGTNILSQVTQGPGLQKGVYYRPLLPYELILTGESFTRREIIFLPNGAPILSLDLTRGAFIKKAIKVTFDDGILSELYINKPSEASGALDIPLNVIKSVVALPTELIQLKINYSENQTKLLEARLKELQALKALMEEKKKPAASTGEPSSLTPGSLDPTIKVLQALRGVMEKKQKTTGEPSNLQSK